MVVYHGNNIRQFKLSHWYTIHFIVFHLYEAIVSISWNFITNVATVVRNVNAIILY